MAWFLDVEYKDYENQLSYAPSMTVIPEEQARLKEMGLALGKEIEAKWLAGDRNRNSPNYPWFGLGRDIPDLDDGWRYPIPDRPFRLILNDYEKPIIDIIPTGFGTFGISQRVIDLIEAIEPGVHQYLPLDLVRPDGSIHPDRRWLLNICTRAEVVDTAKSNIVWSRPPSDRWFGDLMGKKHIVLKAEEASRRALWSEWRYNNYPHHFASDRFWNAVQAAGLRGWQPAIAYPNHMEEL